MKFDVTVKTTVSIHDVADCLCGAFEGGSNDWYEINKAKSVMGTPLNDKMDKEWGEFFHIAYPLSKGGSLCIVDRNLEEDEQEEYTLNLDAVKRGLKSWSEENPEQFAEFVEGDMDAGSGDNFLQHCLFGEVVLG